MRTPRWVVVTYVILILAGILWNLRSEAARTAAA